MSTAGTTAVLARASWPEAQDDVEAGPPRLPGFVVSSFSPLAAEAADRCLRRHYGEAPAPAQAREHTAVVVVSRLGDLDRKSVCRERV